MRLVRLSGRGACLSLALALSSCSGSGSAPSTFAANATNPGSPIASKAARVVPTSFTFRIPRPSARGATYRRQPQYLPATTLSLEVQLVTIGGSAPSPTPSPTIADVSGCPATSGGYTCTVTVGLPVGTDVVLVKSFDAAGATGNVLSQQNGTYTVVAGSANAFTMTLAASPGTIALSNSGTACTGSPLTCSVTGTSALSFTVTVADAHGTVLANNTIPGSPVVSVASSNSAIATVTANQAPYGISVTPVANGSATIAVTASPATGTSGLSPTTVNLNITVAPQPTLTGPAGVALDSAGNLYVVARSEGKLKIFNSAGAASSIAGGSITTATGPWGTAVDVAGNIYVANPNSNNVQIFTSTGAVSTIAGGTITGLSSPYGVAVDSAGNIYVANFSAHNVKIFTNTGAPSPIAGGTITTGMTNFSSPCGIALDGAGNIYVSDCGANTVRIFTNSTTAGGVLSTTIGVGATGTISAGMNNPLSVAVDSAGNIYVANFGNNSNTVNVFTSVGVLSHTITTGLNPAGLAVAGGSLYVANNSNANVTVYNASTGALLNTIH